MKDYQTIAIAECFEPLIPIPLEKFVICQPHPYQNLGANYGGKSPYYLREGVIAALIKSAEKLHQKQPGWKIKIFDAYRPVEVQDFMVKYTFDRVIESQKLKSEDLSPQERDNIWQQVYQFWAIPSLDPRTPPPHSTGAAIDVTLVNERGQTIDMGSEIDELGARSHPDYYLSSNENRNQKYHERRSLLHEIMKTGGFSRHPGEWWHFSLGDQMWAKLLNFPTAYYGRIDE
ncbi:MAG: M15 family metallopeptidase [Prochloraceae cyanobacterium]|nr:M15 family metallopeptidase [Prochloraceae cyanobacterium]